uniref:DUF4457 domain-containing protein n=1 Tax=Heterorhabditis bacteriophora TaxID=37862 RepID=A0A1I7WVM0_HETBA
MPNPTPEYALGITPERPLTSQESSLSKVSNEILPSSIVNEDLTDEVLGMVKDLFVVFHMELSSNWGSPDCIGLTGLEFMGARGEVIDTEAVSISVSNAQSGVEKILNGKNLTRSKDDMWMTTFDAKTPPIIMVQFPKPVAMTGISLWNYNASPELSYAGVRVAQLFVNGRLAVGNLLLRKAPVIFQLRLLSSWGDEFYIGLNGIELYNRKDEKMMLKTHNLAAFPESINILPAVDGDPRTSENLIDNCNDMDRPEHMWLTPLFPNRCARVFFIFDVPTFISRMIVYNYRKTPTRGVRHISLIVFSDERMENC